MPKLLLTGFRPWGEHSSNAACETIRALAPSLPNDWTLEKREFPVSWRKVPELIDDCLQTTPDVFIAFGQFDGSEIRIETTARNRAQTDQADVDGRFAANAKIDLQGPETLSSRLPTIDIAAQLDKKEIPSSLSTDAGGYLCNFLFYHQMSALRSRELSVSAGFIHLPLLKTWPIERCIDAAKTVIETTLHDWSQNA